ncbi:MAG TPA: hypothetical protein VFT74_02330, partial [Isosphaeraceae bacterium]|nr:hypothetical protein [Isosphaeraceae bacterium]
RIVILGSSAPAGTLTSPVAPTVLAVDQILSSGLGNSSGSAHPVDRVLEQEFQELMSNLRVASGVTPQTPRIVVPLSAEMVDLLTPSLSLGNRRKTNRLG